MSKPNVNLFRIHIRPYGGEASPELTFNYCLNKQLLGVGWRVNSQKNTKKWEEYEREASNEHGDLQICRYIKNHVAKGDLVWTRDPKGQYYLARVTSEWEYWESDESKNNDIDIANIFRVAFKAIPSDAVPGKVVACFRPSKTIQPIRDETVMEYTKYLWNKFSDESIYPVDKSNFPDIFTMLDDEETEDLVFLYLQSKGWYVIPHSRKGDTMSFEYLAIRPSTNISGKETALTQVKTGDTPISVELYGGYPETVYLFQSKELYHGRAPDNVVCIKRKELLEFLDESFNWLPDVLRNKMKMLTG